MITGKNNTLFYFFLARKLIHVFLGFNKDKLVDKVKNRIFRENVLPHIGHAVFILKNRIPFARVYSFAITHIERQKESRLPVKFGRHIHFVQVHCEVYNTPHLKPEQTRFGIALQTILLNRIRIRLPRKVAFKLKRHNRQTVQKDYQVNAFFIARPYFFHHGKDIFVIIFKELFVERSRRLGIHKL